METKYLDYEGLEYYNSLIKTAIGNAMNSANEYTDQQITEKQKTGKLTFGKYEYDGTQDVAVDVYDGTVE